MPFGLKTAGASFTRAMHKVLGEDCSSFLIVYLDDILIASSGMEEHLQHIDFVLRKLEDVGFKLNKDKCKFAQEKIKFLGQTFDEIEVEINEETKLAIQIFERPKNKQAVHSFLGLVNWDRRFIKNLARLVKPLKDLLKKGKKFKWNEEQQKAFTGVKSAFAEASTLYLAKLGYKYGIYVDAAKSGLGARLYQYCRIRLRNTRFKVRIVLRLRHISVIVLSYPPPGQIVIKDSAEWRVGRNGGAAGKTVRGDERVVLR